MSAAAFIQELRADPRFAGSSVADDLEAALLEMDLEGAELVDADSLHRAISWIMAQPDSLDKRLAAISRLNALGKVVDLDMRQFYYGPQ
jgi:hypothetical protein